MKGTGGSNRATTLFMPSTPVLRVPVYAVLRPASVMQAISSTLDFTSITTTQLSLAGQGLSTGAQYPTDTLSLVSAFELAESSPLTTTPHAEADLYYLGVSNDFAATGAVTATTLFFAIATYGNWSVPLAANVQFKVILDTDRNGTTDFVLTNDTLNGQANDIFYSRLINLSNTTTTFPMPINYLSATSYDTVLFNTDTLILAVPASSIGLTEANPRFNYRVETYAAGLFVDTSAIHTYSADLPGLDFSGGLSSAPIWPDLPDAAIPVRFNPTSYTANRSLGALLLHHHNATAHRLQMIAINP